ncbi:MAG: hypothetical protein ACLFM1_11330 [Bacteroidales bacterium]
MLSACGLYLACGMAAFVSAGTGVSPVTLPRRTKARHTTGKDAGLRQAAGKPPVCHVFSHYR